MFQSVNFSRVLRSLSFSPVLQGVSFSRALAAVTFSHVLQNVFSSCVLQGVTLAVCCGVQLSVMYCTCDFQSCVSGCDVLCVARRNFL